MQNTSQNTKKVDQFKYEFLPSQKRINIQKLTLEIKESLRKTVFTIWETGKKLVEVRSQLEQCQFSLWLKVEFDWSRRTAYNFINVYEAFPEFASANFAQIDISISALYLLAAPSTQEDTRSYFLNQALAGEYVSHKVIQRAIKEVKPKQADNDKLAVSTIPRSDVYEDNISIKLQPSEIGYPISDSEATTRVKNSEVKNSDVKTFKPEQASEDFTTTSSLIRPAWNQIKEEFSLFWGDTASPRFTERLPKNSFILAIPSSQWHQDWLLNKSINLNSVILYKPILGEKLVEELLSAFSLGQKSVIFPWLPDWKMIKLALKLNIKVYAGDPELNRCEKVVSKLGVNLARIDLC